MYTQLLANLAILVLAGFVGFAVISKVPNTLHTPLMSGTNAIHGIVVPARCWCWATCPPTRTGACGSSPSSRWCSARSTSSAASW
jgi:NAD/NADP transhydrogenase alpha subunit